MRHQAMPSSFFIDNRKKFVSEMKSNTIAIMTSNDIKHTNADDVMGFAQNNDLYWLSGIEQEESILFLYPDAYKQEFREILFVLESNEHIKTWEGDKLDKEKASQLSGVERVEWLKDFEKIIQLVVFESDGIYLGHNEHIKRITIDQETRQDRMIKWCKQKYPLHEMHRAAKITRYFRQIKSSEEVSMIQNAVEIGTESFHMVLKQMRAGVMEYEVEAILNYNLIRSGGIRHAFKPIIASGANACALHYNSNDHLCKDGDMLLMDFGVCYGNYNSDTTRCIPVNGKFSERQRQVYKAVLHCLKEGSKMLKPGVVHADYEKNMAKLVEEQLIDIGLLDLEKVNDQDPQKPLYKKYFMHGTAHHLGLDVHDVGLYSRDIEAGMVFTCEPGIYIREEVIGCRLEDDFLITENGNINLSKAMPIEIDEIEALMRK